MPNITCGIVAYWLCPAEPAGSHFCGIVSDLAGRFDAPVFEPHVTIYVANGGSESPVAILEQLVEGRQPYRLFVRGVECSDKFTKTVFVQFAPNAELARLSEDLRRASASPSDYKTNPHLSLLYKDLDTETKRRVAASISLPFTEVTFDGVKAIVSPAEIKSRDDIEAWRVIAECSLTA